MAVSIWSTALDWTQRRQKIKLSGARPVSAMIGEIDDLALARPVDGPMRLVDKARETFGVPVITARLAPEAVHALLHHGPFAIVGHKETMQVKIEAVLHGGAIDFCDQPARARQGLAVKADTLAKRNQLFRRAARMLAATAADVDAELFL